MASQNPFKDAYICQAEEITTTVKTCGIELALACGWLALADWLVVADVAWWILLPGLRLALNMSLLMDLKSAFSGSGGSGSGGGWVWLSFWCPACWFAFCMCIYVGRRETDKKAYRQTKHQTYKHRNYNSQTNWLTEENTNQRKGQTHEPINLSRPNAKPKRTHSNTPLQTHATHIFSWMLGRTSQS